MKPRVFFLNLVLAALLLTACAPQATQAAAPPPQATQAPAVVPIVTSRGDKLEATDPATVSLASGEIQLIEFFRFT